MIGDYPFSKNLKSEINMLSRRSWFNYTKNDSDTDKISIKIGVPAEICHYRSQHFYEGVEMSEKCCKMLCNTKNMLIDTVNG